MHTQAGAGRVARIPPPSLIASQVFPGRPEHVRDVRRWVCGQLPECPAREDLELVASELVGNAILHTASGDPGGAVAACLTWSPERARIIIADGGATTVPTLIPFSDGERQRGLAVVDRLALAWRHTTAPDTTSRRWTWADLRWDGPAPDAVGGRTDVATELAGLRAAHHGVRFWYGEHTGTWWAAHQASLFDAPCPGALAAMTASLPR
jgi:anti-sigma regulatory factor (Ser/Thr protein kinase)